MYDIMATDSSLKKEIKTKLSKLFDAASNKKLNFLNAVPNTSLLPMYNPTPLYPLSFILYPLFPCHLHPLVLLLMP